MTEVMKKRTLEKASTTLMKTSESIELFRILHRGFEAYAHPGSNGGPGA